MDQVPTIALAGNPNVGKSTVFNQLTGLHQHTGNWPGKTVACANGNFRFREKTYALVDLPGTYSLFAHSAEEEIAREFILEEKPDAVIIVCDATGLARSLTLALQIQSLTDRCLLCVNLCDEAFRKGIHIHFSQLQSELGMPVVPCSAAKGDGIEKLMAETARICDREKEIYREKEEKKNRGEKREKEVKERGYETEGTPGTNLDPPRNPLCAAALDPDETTARSWIRQADQLAKHVIQKSKGKTRISDKQIDCIVTSRLWGIPLMLFLLTGLFWLTVKGANYPSQWLSRLLFSLEKPLLAAASFLRIPNWISSALIFGAYRVLAWVVSVMLPPMAIFFPLFTFLEDLGYLPRIAFNLDFLFQKCSSCGKQALTMCMGLGCNAVGVTGCRIIDSPRERLLAILTNSFIPCNGRFPTLLALITIFFTGISAGSSVLGAFSLALVICFSMAMTFFATWLLSKTILRGQPSAFTMELPPYRRPQFKKILVRSVLDRTLFVLGRAVIVAAPAGLVIWIFVQTAIQGQSLLAWGTSILNPLGRFLGLDGVILMAFLLGLPANEIVLPIILMCYLSSGTLIEYENYTQLHEILAANGWTPVTAVCAMVFSLMHWPCSTTCITIYKESGSIRWTLLAVLIPTILGIFLCATINGVAGILIRSLPR